MEPKRFSQKEVRKILDRANRIQVLGPSFNRDDLTLAEIEAIAAEAGISPDAVREAAQHNTRGADTSNTTLMSKWESPGVISDDEWEAVVDRLRQTFGTTDKPERQSAMREWYGGSDFTKVTATLTEREGKTKFRLLADIGAGTWFTWMMSVIPTFLACLAIGKAMMKASASPLWITAAIIAVLLLGAGVGFFISQIYRKRIGEMLNHISQDVAARLVGHPDPIPLESSIPSGEVRSLHTRS